MRLAGLQKTSLIDYPEKICAVVFTQGCNFRCGYCHNPELNGEKGNLIEENEVLEFLKTRQNKLEAVVITGGEPTLQKDLKEFIKKIKALDFLVKLDTNGSNPFILKQLVEEKLIDYVAMDIKSPLNKYSEITKSDVDVQKIKESINFLINSEIDYEFRTTVVKSQLKKEDFEKILTEIKGAKRYYLQKFIPTKTIDKRFLIESSYNKEEFQQIIEILLKNIKTVELR